MHFCTLVCSAIEISEKEKIKKYKTMTKHEIRENILNLFIMPPPLIYRYVSQIITGMNPNASFGNVSQQAAGYHTLRFAG